MPGDISDDFGFWKWFGNAVRLLWSSIVPAPEFGSTTQQLREEDSASWLHVSIGVRKAFRIGNRYIPCCEATLLIFEADGITIKHSKAMRWQSDLLTCSHETTLIEGKDRLIPIVSRADGEQECLITDEEYFINCGKSPPYSGNNELWLPHSEEDYLTRIAIKSGEKTWISPRYYTLRVPRPGASNSHFNLELARKAKEQ